MIHHLSYYIETVEPEIIICAPQTIIDGSPTKAGFRHFNCEITDYKKNYIKLDTQIYLDNPNREYYYNPAHFNRRFYQNQKIALKVFQIYKERQKKLINKAINLACHNHKFLKQQLLKPEKIN